MEPRRTELIPVKATGLASVIPGRDEWSTIYDMAKMLVPTGFLPQAIKTPEQATAVILKGRELQVPPMYALSNIVIVNGKPTCSAELMLALVHRDCGRDAIRVKHSDNKACTVQWRQWGEVNEYSFTIEDAKQAGLLSNPTWTKYPAAMLRARCISAVCRMAFPGSIAGMYTPEELGAVVTVGDDGTVDVVQDERHAAYVASAHAASEPSAPTKTTVQLSPPSEPPTDLKRLKGELWETAQAKGLDADLLDDYAVTRLGDHLKDLAPGALAELRTKLAAEDAVALRMELTGELPSENPELFADVDFGVNTADRFTR